MSITLNLDQEIEQRLQKFARSTGESPDTIVNRLLETSLSPAKYDLQTCDSTCFRQQSPQEWEKLTPEYRKMIEEYEQKVAANTSEETAAAAVTANQPPRARFVVKPFDLGELPERFHGMTPTEIDYQLEMEAYEEKRERARHESAGVRV